MTHVSVCCHSVDGHPLPIDELKGIKAVESIDLSGKKLGIASTIIIGACIAGNAHLRELKCALPPNPSGSVTLGRCHTAAHICLFWVQFGQERALRRR